MMSALLIADEDDADDVLESHDPVEEYEGVWAKPLDQIRLGALYAITFGLEYDPDCTRREFPLLVADDSDGMATQWTYGVSAKLVQHLAQLDNEGRSALGHKWADDEAEEAHPAALTASDTYELLTRLSSLCARAVEQDYGVMLWVAL